MALTRLGLNQSINLATNTTGTLAVANGGTGLTSGFVNGTTNVGKILQVQSQTLASEASTNSTSFSDTGLTINITPSAATSKILVMVSLGMIYSTSNSEMQLKLFRGSTDLGRFVVNSAPGVVACGSGINQLDTPNSTSQQTYKVQFKYNAGGGNVYICINNSSASITAMEIAA